MFSSGDPSTDRRIQRCHRDRDRIVACPAFRRLAGKTQVVCLPEDPLVRTRLTHTLEVSSIAREVGRGLGLVDPCIEAIALGHDLGHPAFGHAGEKALSRLLPGGFRHALQSVRVVTELEPDLQLGAEVVEGIRKHSKGRAGEVFVHDGSLGSLSREGQVVRAADLYAYACHDLEDAFVLGLLSPGDVPREISLVLGSSPGGVRASLVAETIRSSLAKGDLSLAQPCEAALEGLRALLYERFYESPGVARQTERVERIIESLWQDAEQHPDVFYAALVPLCVGSVARAELARDFVDAVAMLTDRQALGLCKTLRSSRRCHGATGRLVGPLRGAPAPYQDRRRRPLRHSRRLVLRCRRHDRSPSRARRPATPDG